MRVAIYDKNPGASLMDDFLVFTWWIGCFLFKLFGKIDAYYGAASYPDAFDWLLKQKAPLDMIQVWSHGSPGVTLIGGRYTEASTFSVLKDKVTPASVIWFRSCSTFQGLKGYAFSKTVADELNCTVAGYTRIIGFFQGGLHTRKPHTDPSWPTTEVEIPSMFAAWGLCRGNNTIFCLRATIPAGW